MTMTKSRTRAVDLHRSLSSAFLATAGAVPPAQWDLPIAPGKWTPGEITVHLIATYEVVLRELRGGEGMRVVLSRSKQLLAMVLAGWKILWFGTFPKAARAPRETRPAAGLPKEEALARFRTMADEVSTAAGAAPAGASITHAYFGVWPATRGIIVVARHIEHHRRQLEARVGTADVKRGHAAD